MNLFEKLAMHLLRRCGWQLTEFADSWSAVFAASKPLNQEATERLIASHLLAEQSATCLQQHAIDLVIDVGAHLGSFATRIRESGYQGDLLSLEPNPVVFETLSSSAADDGAWYVKNRAVSNCIETVNLNVARDSSFSSIRCPTALSAGIFGDLSKVESVVAVDAAPLSETIRKLEVETGHQYRRLFLKTDTQGYDRIVVDSLADYAERVQVLLVEMPLLQIYDGVEDFESLFGYYRASGFQLRGVHPVSWASNKAIVELDCLFIREST